MLTRLHVRGYKALRDIETTLEPLTVIVGPNGCGKTSVLEAIAMVRDFVADPDGAGKLHSFQELRWKGASSSSEIVIDLGVRPALADRERLSEASAQILSSEEMGRMMDKFLRMLRPPGATGERDEHVESGTQADESKPRDANPRISEIGLRFEHDGAPATSLLVPRELEDLARAPLRSIIGSVRRLELDARALARPSYLREVTPRMGDDGSGLATVLSAVIGEQHEQFEEIQDRLREFVPELVRIRIRPASLSVVETQEVPVALDDEGKEILARKRYQREVVGHEILLDFRHAKGVPAKHASEGTLLLLGLLTVVHTGNISTLLLDDVDRALHPKAQQQLVAYLRKLTEKGIQVIATSHSPYLVLHLEYEEVRIMTMSESDGALIGKPSDHPEYQRWCESMTPSEFWTVFGEEWLTKVQSHG